MNIYYQIALGLIPAVLIFLLLRIISKKFKIRNIIMTVFFAAIAISSTAYGAFNDDSSNISDTKLKADNMLFTYALIDNGALSTAKDVLKSEKLENIYTIDNTLAMARIAVLEGKLQIAKALYHKLPLAAGESEAVSMLPDYIFDENDEYINAQKPVKKAVNSFLYITGSENYTKAARIAVFAETSYNEFLMNGIIDEEELKKNLKRLNEIYEETPELLSIAPLRLSRLKLQLLLEDYKGIAGSIDTYADYNELLIVSELYMNGYVKTSNFSEDYRNDSLEEYSSVISAMDNIYNDVYANKSREERNAAKEQIKTLKAFIKNPALIKISNGLNGYAESGYAYDRSKVYLQLAKTEHYMGNTTKTVEYMDKSLNTVGDCDDTYFTVPMYEIIGIIADKDSPERLKDVAVYTDKILTNTMTVQMSSELRTPQDASDNMQVENNIVSDFQTQFETYTSQKRMAINIVNVDTSGFDTVKAKINLSGDISYSVEELKSLLQVADCDIDIENFNLKKITYSKANILLCVDVSGSMGGQPINDLREAVKLFVQSTDAIESVAIVAFNDGISNVWTFGTPNDELITAADSLYANGGTNMYGAVMNSIGYFTEQPDAINCVILLSDGEDNNPATLSEIKDNIGIPYKSQGITLYSLGFGGGAAAEYLNALAGSTGGSYVYASDSMQIQNFFDGIRAQILNSYELTFKAEDTLRNTRNLRVSMQGESYVYDEHWYSLDGGEIADDNDTGNVIYLEGKAIYGFEEKLLFKSDRSRQVRFKGEGFEDTDKFTISLNGHINYDSLNIEYQDDKTLLVTIPAGIACDVYNVKVSVNGKRTVLTSGLAIVTGGSEKTTQFGSYIFTSYFKYQENDTITLSTYVKMNGWLNFKGDVILNGDMNSQNITMISDKQSYVTYHLDSSEGLARIFAVLGADVPIPALGKVTLYNQYLFADNELRVDSKPISYIMISGFMRLSTPGISLYPDRIAVNTNEFSTDLPFQNKLLKGVGLFDFTTELEGSVGSKSIDLKAEIGAESGDKKGKLAKSPANLGNIPIFLNTNEFELKLDTYENEFYVKYISALPFIGDDANLGASVKWKWGDNTDPGVKFDELMLYSDFDIPLKGSPIDLTFSDFKIGLTDITSDNPTLTGGFDLGAYKLSSILPGIEKYLGEMADVSALAADDAEVKFGLKDFYIKAQTTVKLLKFIELGGIELEIGKFEYTNKLLGLEDENIGGFVGTITAGPKISMKNCDVSLQGSLELAATNRFGGATVEGNADIDVKWWIFTKEFHAQGLALIGVQYTHDGDIVFLMKASGGKNVFGIQWSKREGYKNVKHSL